MSKYKANPLYFHSQTSQVITAKDAKGLDKSNLQYFASQHEFNVYQTLLPFKERHGFELKTQSPVELIKPKLLTSYPKGKTWLADFELKDKDSTLMLVEAKGVLLKEFLLILALLELTNQEFFDKLWLIFPRQLPQNNEVINRLLKTPMKERLLTMKEFERYIHLRT
jgi:hypothetical protein